METIDCNKGFVPILRGILDQPIWRQFTPQQKVIYFTLILNANYEINDWEFKGFSYALQPGQLITSLESIREKTGTSVSIQQIRLALKKFVRLNLITNESTNQNRLITILNWKSQFTVKGINDRRKTKGEQTENTSLPYYKQRSHNQLATNNKVNNFNKENNAKKIKTDLLTSHNFFNVLRTYFRPLPAKKNYLPINGTSIAPMIDEIQIFVDSIGNTTLQEKFVELFYYMEACRNKMVRTDSQIL